MRLLLLLWLFSSAGQLDATADVSPGVDLTTAAVDAWASAFHATGCGDGYIRLEPTWLKFQEASHEHGCARSILPIETIPGAKTIHVTFYADRHVERPITASSAFRQSVQLLAGGEVVEEQVYYPLHDGTQPFTKQAVTFHTPPPSGPLAIAWTFEEMGASAEPQAAAPNGAKHAATVRDVTICHEGIPLLTSGSEVEIPPHVASAGSVALEMTAEGSWVLSGLEGPQGPVPRPSIEVTSTGATTSVFVPELTQGSGTYSVFLSPAGATPPGWALAVGTAMVAAALWWAMQRWRREPRVKRLVTATLIAAGVYAGMLVPLTAASLPLPVFHAIHTGLVGTVMAPAALAARRSRPSRAERALASELLDAHDRLRSDTVTSVHQDALEAYALRFNLGTPPQREETPLRVAFHEVLETALPGIVSAGTILREPETPDFKVVTDPVYVPAALASLLVRAAARGPVVLDWRVGRRIILSFEAPRGTLEEVLLRDVLEAMGGAVARTGRRVHVAWRRA